MLLLVIPCSFEIASARHKCPKVPSPPGIMGIFSSTTLIPSGSVMAAARSSETLGCDRGHPSDNFYKPQKERVSMFLEDNLHHVREESARGQGLHLEALSLIAGCSISHSDFGKIVKTSYSEVFDPKDPGPAENLVYEVEQTTERFISLMRQSPLLASGCESG
ncbi:MAG: DUF3015 family protein [SAR324 cluster bacterium]|jgi:hypothetical protein|nr:DUF3015 family protein [SAR324 cluster bacterium]